MSEHGFDRLARAHAEGLSRRQVLRAAIGAGVGFYAAGPRHVASALASVAGGRLRLGRTVVCEVSGRRSKPRCKTVRQHPRESRSPKELLALARDNGEWQSLTGQAVGKGFDVTVAANTIYVTRSKGTSLVSVSQTFKNAAGRHAGLFLVDSSKLGKPLVFLYAETGDPEAPVEVLAPAVIAAHGAAARPTASAADACDSCKLLCEAEAAVVIGGAVVLPADVATAAAGTVLAEQGLTTVGSGLQKIAEVLSAVVGAVVGVKTTVSVGDACQAYCTGAGVCDCPSGTHACGGLWLTCVLASIQNCAGCGDVCESPKICDEVPDSPGSYECQCPQCPAGMRPDPTTCQCLCTSTTDCAAIGLGTACCGDTCVDTNADPNNCGSCGHVCGHGQPCENGNCTGCQQNSDCSTGEICCTSMCANIETDVNNCGSCGNQCQSGQMCQSGSCTGCTSDSDCGPGEGCCPLLGCVDLISDYSNCGTCGNVCGHPYGYSPACIDGHCQTNFCGGAKVGERCGAGLESVCEAYDGFEVCPLVM